jgi:hypothetical protein
MDLTLAQICGVPMSRLRATLRSSLNLQALSLSTFLRLSRSWRSARLPRMSNWSGKLVLVMALAMMPLQGVAATLTVLLCHGDAQMHAVHATGGDHGHDTGDAAHEHGHHAAAGGHDDGSGGNGSYHLCCNLSASAPPATAIPPALTDFPVRVFAPVPMQDLFIPDRPQRPPLV